MTLIIAHKLSTVRQAHSIAVVAEGAVIEQGTHKELLQKNGAYARLVDAQSLGDEQKQGEEPEKQDWSAAEEERLLNRATSTRVEEPAAAAAEENKQTMGYGLLRIIYIIVSAKPQLWWRFAIMGSAAALVGKWLPQSNPRSHTTWTNSI